MALIIKGSMPVGCAWHDRTDGRVSYHECPLRVSCDCEAYFSGDRPPDCPILGEVNPDSFKRIVVTTGDGTAIGYKDISVRDFLREVRSSTEGTK